MYCRPILTCQLPLKVSNETNDTACALSIDPNLERYRAVSPRQLGFLVLNVAAACQLTIMKSLNVHYLVPEEINSSRTANR